MRRAKPISVRVRAPSRGLVSRLPGESADRMQAQGGLVPGTEKRAASRASNVRYEDGVVCNAPGYEKVALQSALLDGLVAAWSLDETAGNRLDATVNNHLLTPVEGLDDRTGLTATVGSEGGQFALAAVFPALSALP
jgi:hypothetical protein